MYGIFSWYLLVILFPHHISRLSFMLNSSTFLQQRQTSRAQRNYRKVVLSTIIEPIAGAFFCRPKQMTDLHLYYNDRRNGIERYMNFHNEYMPY